MRLLHIVAGLIGLASGAVALYALKGARLHRKSGMIFVYAMLFVSSSGAVMAALKPQRLSVMACVLTLYLVITALLTVRRRVVGFHGIDLGAMLVALTVGIASVRFGFEALDSATGKIDGVPAAPGALAHVLLAGARVVHATISRRPDSASVLESAGLSFGASDDPKGT
jgi:uncharacterized membrane protein